MRVGSINFPRTGAEQSLEMKDRSCQYDTGRRKNRRYLRSERELEKHCRPTKNGDSGFLAGRCSESPIAAAEHNRPAVEIFHFCSRDGMQLHRKFPSFGCGSARHGAGSGVSCQSHLSQTSAGGPFRFWVCQISSGVRNSLSLDQERPKTHVSASSR